MILAAIILFFGVLAWDLWTDYNKWLAGPFNHKDKWKRAVLLLPSMVLFACPLHSFWFGLLYSWAMVGFIYWSAFDSLFNIIRKYPWDFVGLPDPFDANFDKLQRKYKWIPKAKIIVSLGLKIGYIIMLL